MYARAFEGGEIIDGRTPVAGSAGHNDGTGARALLTAEQQQKAAVVEVGCALQRDDLVRDGNGGAEFLGLAMGSPHQRHAADAGRET